MKILYITTDWNTPYRIATGEYGGVGYYRAYGPAKALRSEGHLVDVKGHDFGAELESNDLMNSYKKVFDGYDVVVMKQADTRNASTLIGACKTLDIPIVMDLDDLIIDMDEDNPAAELGYGDGGVKKAMAAASLSMCDALFVSTQPLKDEYQKFLKESIGMDMPIYVLPNCMDFTMWTKMKKHDDDWMRLGWQGSITHDGDLKIVVPQIHELMKKHPKLCLSLTGGIRQETYDTMFLEKFKKNELERVDVLRGTESYPPFPEYLSRHQWDIGIVPLKNTRFANCKSHIKWMENSLLGVPSIVSDTYPYTEPIDGLNVVVDGETGLISKDSEWYDKIESLIDNEKERRRLAKNAYRFVREEWTYNKHIYKWESAFQSVLNEGSKSLT